MTEPRSNMRLLLMLAVALLAVVAVIWMLTGSGGDGEEAAEPTYEVGVTDESGGELIVADPDAPRIEDQTLPEVEMTNVPPATETPAPAAE